MTHAQLQSPKRAWHLPATFVVAALSASLMVDTFQAWALSGVTADCYPQFTVLYFGNPLYGVNPAARVDEQAVLAWEQRVAKKYGGPYANFGYAQSAHKGIKQCYSQLDGSPNYCGFASGQPCRRMNVTIAP